MVKVQYTWSNYSLSKTELCICWAPVVVKPATVMLPDDWCGVSCVCVWASERVSEWTNEWERVLLSVWWVNKYWLRCFQMISCWPTDCKLTKVHFTCGNNYNGRVHGWNTSGCHAPNNRYTWLMFLLLIDVCTCLSVWVSVSEDPRVCDGVL